MVLISLHASNLRGSGGHKQEYSSAWVSVERCSGGVIGGNRTEAVLAAATRGERWALAALFRAYHPALLRYLRAQAPVVADDIASDVWVGVARRLCHFSGDERGFRGWLFTLARSRVIEHWRKEARRRTESVSDERLDRPSDDGAEGDPAELVVEHLSAQQAVHVLIAGLTPSEAEAVLLRVVAGLAVVEVARIIGRPPSSVRVLCHRALKKMAARFAQQPSEGVPAT